MRPASIIENTGVIICGENRRFLGSCFLFRYPEIVITAHHCVASFRTEELAIIFPVSRAGDRAFPVRRVHSHPSADLAVLQIEPPPERDITWTINEIFNEFALGVDVISYGYPEDWFGHTAQPMQRLFKGHIQRFFEHRSHLGYRYVAAELSFGCPPGLSGSAIINRDLHGRLYGLAAENVRITTEVKSTAEVEEDGKIIRESFHDFINYGVAVWLPAVADWIDSVVPPVPHSEIVRRSENQHAWLAEEHHKP